MQLTKEKQDLTHLSWSANRNSFGVGGSFLKAYSELDRKKTYYKLSNFDKARGVIGHECVNAGCGQNLGPYGYPADKFGVRIPLDFLYSRSVISDWAVIE